MNTKFCKHCGVEHPATQEYWYFQKTWMVCKKHKQANHLKNKDHRNETSKNYNKSHKEDICSQKKEYYQRTKIKRQEYDTMRRERDKNKIKQRKREYYLKNSARILDKMRQVEIGPEQRDIKNRKYNEYCKNRLKHDIQFRLSRNLRTRLNSALNKNYKSGSAVKDLGCTIQELKQHLESKFQEGMNWDNWGKGCGKWNIDHITPLASFDLTDREQFLKACHYTNLQPLWSVDNLRKGAN